MMEPETRTLTEAERHALDASLTFIARAVGLAFAAIGLGPAVILGIGTALNGDPVLRLAAFGMALGGVAMGSALGGFLWLLSRPARQALLGAPLRRGSGHVTAVSWPNQGGGGSTVVSLALTLPDGSERSGTLRLHAAKTGSISVGETWTLWFATPPITFVLDDLSTRCDPGAVR